MLESLDSISWPLPPLNCVLNTTDYGLSSTQVPRPRRAGEYQASRAGEVLINKKAALKSAATGIHTGDRRVGVAAQQSLALEAGAHNWGKYARRSTYLYEWARRKTAGWRTC